MNQKNRNALTVVAVGLSAIVCSSAMADNRITYYCSQDNANIQHVVEVGEITSVQVHDGPFMMLSEPSELNISQSYLRAELDKINLPSACKEYLLSQAGFSTYAEGELIARVYFEFDKSNLTKESVHILDQLEHDLKVGQTDLLVEGHTDNIGSESYNMKLGLNRAKAVEHHLQELGANPSNIVISSKGESSPIATNQSEAGRSENRRVDLSKIGN
jgi:outer membrane protein OmpA-like peptidoglycan-associated protein